MPIDTELENWAREYYESTQGDRWLRDFYVELTLRKAEHAASMVDRGPKGNQTPDGPEHLRPHELLEDCAPLRCQVVGDDSSGKTLTSKYLGLYLSQRYMEGIDERLPVNVQATFGFYSNDSASSENGIWDLIGRTITRKTPSYPRQALARAAEAGRLVLIVDDLEDVNGGLRDANPRNLAAWSSKYPLSRCIVTSQLERAPRLQGFQRYEFVSLDRYQAAQLLRLRFRTDDSEELLQELTTGSAAAEDIFRSRKSLIKYAETHMVTSTTPELSPDRFAQMVNVKLLRNLDPPERVPVLAVLTQLAHKMVGFKQHLISYKELRKIAEANARLLSSNVDGLIDAVWRADCLVGDSSSGQIGFVHRGLIEHFSGVNLGDLDRIWTPSAPTSECVQVVHSMERLLVQKVMRQPRDLYSLSARDFEILMAELFRDQGWTVELTKQTRDGGADIIAVRSDVGSHLKMLIEAKRRAPDSPIGVGVVRELYGVRQLHRVSKVMLATTSYFSPAAQREFAPVIPWELELSDYNQILSWIKEYGG